MILTTNSVVNDQEISSFGSNLECGLPRKRGEERKHTTFDLREQQLEMC